MIDDVDEGHLPNTKHKLEIVKSNDLLIFLKDNNGEEYEVPVVMYGIVTNAIFNQKAKL